MNTRWISGTPELKIKVGELTYNLPANTVISFLQQNEIINFQTGLFMQELNENEFYVLASFNVYEGTPDEENNKVGVWEETMICTKAEIFVCDSQYNAVSGIQYNFKMTNKISSTFIPNEVTAESNEATDAEIEAVDAELVEDTEN